MAIKIHRDYKSNLVIIEGIETKSSPTGILTASVVDSDFVTVTDRTSPSSQAEIFRQPFSNFVNANNDPAGATALDVVNYLNAEFQPRLAITFFRGYSNTEADMISLPNPFEGDYVFRTDTFSLFYYNSLGQWIDSGLSFAPSPPVLPPIVSPLVPPIIRNGNAQLTADSLGYVTTVNNTWIKFAEFDTDGEGVELSLDNVAQNRTVYWGSKGQDNNFSGQGAFVFSLSLEYVNANTVKIRARQNTNAGGFQLDVSTSDELRLQFNGASNKFDVYLNGNLIFSQLNATPTPLFFYGQGQTQGTIIRTPLARIDPL